MQKKGNFFIRLFKKISDTSINNTSDTEKDTTNNYIQNSINILNNLLNDSFNSIDLSNNNRQYRYHEYELILSRIPEQNRQLSLIQDLVLNPVEINNKYLQINSNSGLQSDIDNLELLVKKAKIEKILPRIIFNTLLYGDSFVEIQDSTIYNLDKKNQKKSINIIVHDPKNIVIITDKDDNIYGYVKVEGSIDNMQSDFFDNEGNDYNNLISEINKLNENELLVDNEIFELKDSDMKFRFIPLKYMQHFSLTNNNMFYPYGTSYFEPVRSIQNILLLIELSVTIYRLVRQPGHMKYKLDVTGIDPTQYPGYIQTMKQMIRSEKTVNPDLNSASLDETVKLVTMFDDYWIPVRNGTPIYDLEWLTGDNLNTQIDDLNYLHKKLLSQLGIPPSYLGFEEPLSGVQTVLVIQDQRVQRIINRIQKDINEGLNELIYKIAIILGTVQYIQNQTISLTPIKSQDEESKLDLLQKKVSLINQLEQFGINKRFLLKNIMGYNNDEIEEQLLKEENNKKTENDNEIF